MAGGGGGGGVRQQSLPTTPDPNTLQFSGGIGNGVSGMVYNSAMPPSDAFSPTTMAPPASMPAMNTNHRVQPVSASGSGAPHGPGTGMGGLAGLSRSVRPMGHDSRYSASSSNARLEGEAYYGSSSTQQEQQQQHRPRPNTATQQDPDGTRYHDQYQQHQQHQQRGSHGQMQGYAHTRAGAGARGGSGGGQSQSQYKTLFLAASLFEFNIDRSRKEAGYPYLTYVPGEVSFRCSVSSPSPVCLPVCLVCSPPHPDSPSPPSLLTLYTTYTIPSREQYETGRETRTKG